MSDMIRKQVYIHSRQQALLQQLARARGVSEAEIVRQAIEHEATGASQQPLAPDRLAWEEILDFVAARKANDSSGPPYRWNRQDAYQD